MWVGFRIRGLGFEVWGLVALLCELSGAERKSVGNRLNPFQPFPGWAYTQSTN